MLFHIIGAGKLGKTLGRLLFLNHFDIGGVFNRTQSEAEASCAFIGGGTPIYDLSRLNLSPGDALLITTSDDVISPITQKIIEHFSFPPDCLLVHFSGLLPADILKFPSKVPYSVASIHPLRSFANPKTAVSSFEGTLCTVEGDAMAIDRLIPCLKALKARPISIKAADKPRYHASATLASNALVALFDAAKSGFEASGLSSSLSSEMTQLLMQGTLENLKNAAKPSDALTGPVQRGDSQTIFSHRNALMDCAASDLYRTATEYLIKYLTHHDTETNAELMAALKRY